MGGKSAGYRIRGDFVRARDLRAGNAGEEFPTFQTFNGFSRKMVKSLKVQILDQKVKPDLTTDHPATHSLSLVFMILVWYDLFSSHGEEGIKMLEGLWLVGIGLKGTKMEGAGVIVFESQRVLGGRSNYCYTGSWR